MANPTTDPVRDSSTFDELLDRTAPDGNLSAERVRSLLAQLQTSEFTTIKSTDGSAEPALLTWAWDTVEDAILSSVPDTTGLQMRPGGWVLDLRQSAVRTVVAAAVIGGLLAAAGVNELPGYILPSVIPLLFDVSRSRLSRRDRALLLELRLSQTTAQVQQPWPPGALYSRLPAHVQAQVSPEDFADFLDALVRAGVADKAPYDEVRLRTAGNEAWFRLSLSPGAG